MILHIFSQGNVFLQPCLSCYGAAGLGGDYVVVGNKTESDPLPPGVRYLRLGSIDFSAFLAELRQFQGLVIFHGLLETNLEVAHWVLSISQRTFKTGWIIYGAEIQNARLSIDQFHGPMTRHAYYKLKPLRHLLPLIKALPGSDYYRTRKAIKGMDFFIHFIPEELMWAAKELGISRPFLWSTYAIIDDYIGRDLLNQYVGDSPNVLVGNSSSFTSNHLEVLGRMEGQLHPDVKVIVPLSYGNKPYASYVIDRGGRMLGDRFLPITQLMPRPDYNAMLLSCPVVLMNHYRQQGLGNIVTALWMGARVHINPQVSTYQYLKRLGLHVFTIDEFFENRTGGLLRITPLSRDEADHNRDRLSSIFSRENVARELRSSFSSFA